MVETKYRHLVKKLKYEESDGEYLATSQGADLEGLNLSFAWGYRRKIGPWGSDGGVKHIHPYGECLVFTGLDYNNPNSFPAEVELTLGKEEEKYIIDSPTVVVLPAGVPHCPLTTTRVDKPFGFLAISLSGEHALTEEPSAALPAPGDRKYAGLVKKLNLRDTKRTKGGNADFIEGWNGKDMEGFNLNFTWAFHTGLGKWHEHDPHVHPADEALLFVGCDADNPDYLGCEQEIQMGDGDDKEIHAFDTPTVVIAPAGLAHCPLITRRVDRAYCFSAISLNTEHETTWLGSKE